MWLDLGGRSLKNFDPISKEVNSAVLAINDVINYFNVRDKSMEIKPGNEVKIIIRPSIQISSSSFKALDWTTRKCLYSDEEAGLNNLTMFKKYSEKACIFECRIKNAYKRAGCIPWDYPLPESLKMAERCYSLESNRGKDLIKFHNAMNAPDITQGCSCEPDCEFHTYDFQINTQALDVEELCTFSGEQHNPEMDMVLREWEHTNSPLIHWYNAIVKNRTEYNIDEILSDEVNLIHGLPESEATAMCIDMFKRSIVKVAIEVDDTNSQEYLQDLSTTIAEAIGVVGGTLGLFTGASLISIFEFVYWLYRALFDAICRRRERKRVLNKN